MLQEKYRNPKPTVDIVIFLDEDYDLDTSRIVLIKRKNPPFGYAIPGGFVNEGESYEDAAEREAKEETGLDVNLVEQFHTYSDPDRDPRQHTASTVYLAWARGEPVAADDATEILILSLREASERVDLAFDHHRILEDVLWYFNEGVRPGRE